MSEVGKTLRESLMDWLAMRWTVFRAGVSTPLEVEEAEKHIHPDFKRWVAGDPMVTHNPASPYGKSILGSLSRDGRPSPLDIGISKD